MPPEMARSAGIGALCIALLLAVFAVAALTTATGCEPRVTSPYTGQPATESDLLAQRALADAKAERDAQAAIREAEAEAKLATDRLEAERREAEAAFQLAVTRIESDCRQQVTQLQTQYQLDSARISASLSQIIDRAQREMQAIAERTLDTRAEIAAKGEAALREVREKAALLSGIAGAAGDPALWALIPGGTVLGGIVGTFLGAVGKRKAENAAWDEAARTKEEEFARRNAAWDEARATGGAAEIVAALAPLISGMRAEGHRPQNAATPRG